MAELARWARSINPKSYRTSQLDDDEYDREQRRAEKAKGIERKITL